MTEAAPRIVVLRFASGIRVHLVNATERDAIATFSAELLRAGTVQLPLVEALTAEVPIATLREVAGLATIEQAPAVRPSVSLIGLLGACKRFSEAIAASREESAHTEARAELRRFFDRYGVDLDYRVAAPRAAE